MVDGRIEALDAPDVLKRHFEVSSMDDLFYPLCRRAKRSE